MSGTIPLSMTQQFDEFGKPLKGGQLFLIVAGTVSTPQDGFQDSQLTIKLPYPITLDAAGRIPQIFLADGFIKIRLQDARGVVQLASDGIQVIGPSAGGGGGTPVDSNALVQMGNIIARYGIGVLGGYVRLNALTIGSAVSGATERANADTQNLFQYLWGVDPSLVVSGGRGVSAAADWSANKQLTLPDWRGYAMGALDDMGNAPSGRLTTQYFGVSPLVLGAAGGGQAIAILIANVPAHVHNGVTAGMNQNATHAHSSDAIRNIGPAGGAGNWASGPYSVGAAAVINPVNLDHSHNFVTDGGTGLAGQPISVMNPRKLCTLYMKL